MTDDTDVMELVLGLGAAADDPRGLTETQPAADHQSVAGTGAVVVLVVKLMRLERVVGEETIGAGQELRAWPHLTAATQKQTLNTYSCLCSDTKFTTYWLPSQLLNLPLAPQILPNLWTGVNLKRTDLIPGLKDLNAPEMSHED